MKLKDKKLLAFLLAIVMILTLAYQNVFAVSASESDIIEIIEDTNVEMTSEEYTTQGPESETDEYQGSDPVNDNESIGSVSSGEIDFSQDDNSVDLNSFDQPIQYEPVGSGYVAFPDGVYSLKNLGNTNYWASILNASEEADGYAVQTVFSVNPMDSFNRACLFKITRVDGTSRYVIRSMLNNRLGLTLVGSAVRTKEIPINDEDVSASDTFEIVPNGSGYTIKPYNSSYVITAPDSTNSGSSNAKIHRHTAEKAGDRCIWIPYRYTGTGMSEVTLYWSDDNNDYIYDMWDYGATINQEYTINIKFWSTITQTVSPMIQISSNSTEVQSTPIDNCTMSITPKKAGPIIIQYKLVIEGGSIPNAWNSFTYIAVPDFFNNFAYIENGATKQFIDIEGPSTNSGAIIQQWTFHGAAQSRWIFELAPGGYYYVKSEYSDLYIGVDSSNTSKVKQYSYQNDYTKWMVTETEYGNYTLSCKAVSNKVLAIPATNSGNGIDLIMTTYVANTNYCDEWDIEIVLPLSGSEIPYNPSIWNHPDVIELVNCYAYALNNQKSPYNTEDFWTVDPGTTTGHLYSKYEITEDLILYETSMDSINLGFEFNGIGKYATCSPGSYKVALVINTGVDYHWYRQNPDGSWSHKRGRTEVINYDASGEVIFDPENADRYYPNVANYTVFVGFFEVTPLNNMHDFSQ